jgi:GrpB-like predicted nucleotidyltransferase (UPF0157 family)
MKTKKVVVLPYDSSWKDAYEKIKQEIESAASHLIVGVEHVGSTSVEGLSAKPCIDIDVVIKDNSMLSEVIKALADIGYSGYFTLEADVYLNSFREENLFQGCRDLADSAKKLVAMFETHRK